MRWKARRICSATAVIGMVAGLVVAAGPVAAEPSPPRAEAGTPTASQEPDRCFIGRTHVVFLDRPATAAEKQTWVDRFAGGEPHSALPQALATSDEWLSVVVDDLYQQALDRDPDPAGRTYWTGELRDGALVNRIGAQILGSAEAYTNAGGSDAGLVADLYDRILHRSPDAAGQAYWQEQVARRGRGAVAARFFASTESRGDRVDGLYQQILDRVPDPDGRTYWIERLATVNDVRLATQLASSAEAVRRAPEVCTRITRITAGDGPSTRPVISGDGRHVVFTSSASDLVPDDDNGKTDLFTLDTTTGSVVRLTDSTGAGPVPPDTAPFEADISGEGRFVVFHSFADDVVAGDDDGHADVFLWDRTTDTTTRITDGDADSGLPAVSADGRHVVFASLAGDLVEGDGDPYLDVFTWDRTTATTTRITDGDGHSRDPAISADGQHVTFWSKADDLIPGGDPGPYATLYAWDRPDDTLTQLSDGSHGAATRSSQSSDGSIVTFYSEGEPVGDHLEGAGVYDLERTTGTTTRIGPHSNPEPGGSVSADGELVAFETFADLLPDDTNAESDVFVWRRSTGALTQLTLGQGRSQMPDISADGMTVVFSSQAEDLVPDDGNGQEDIFVWTDLG